MRNVYVFVRLSDEGKKKINETMFFHLIKIYVRHTLTGATRGPAIVAARHIEHI